MQIHKDAMNKRGLKTGASWALAASVCLALNLSTAGRVSAQPETPAAGAPAAAASGSVSQPQVQSVVATLEIVAQNAERLDASMNRLYPGYGTPQQGGAVVSALNPALDAAVRLRSSLSGLLKQLRALPKNGTPEQAIALRDTLKSVTSLTDGLETVVAQLRALSQDIERG